MVLFNILASVRLHPETQSKCNWWHILLTGSWWKMRTLGRHLRLVRKVIKNSYITKWWYQLVVKSIPLIQTTGMSPSAVVQTTSSQISSLPHHHRWVVEESLNSSQFIWFIEPYSFSQADAILKRVPSIKLLLYWMVDYSLNQPNCGLKYCLPLGNMEVSPTHPEEAAV